MQLARDTQESSAPDGTPLIGRGYEVRDDGGAPVAGEDLHPGRFREIAVVDIETGIEHEQELRNPAFGVGRSVRLDRGETGGVAVRDESGRLQAGWLPDEVAEPLLDVLEREPDLATWVCWEWLRDQGRAGLRVAVSRADLAPRRMGPPPQGTSAQAATALRNPRTWAIVAAVVVALAILFVSCT